MRGKKIPCKNVIIFFFEDKRHKNISEQQRTKSFMLLQKFLNKNIICSVLQNLTKTLYVKYEKCYQITDTLVVCSTDLSTKLFICGKGLRFYLSTCHNLVLHYPAYSTVMYFCNIKYTQIHRYTRTQANTRHANDIECMYKFKLNDKYA